VQWEDLSQHLRFKEEISVQDVVNKIEKQFNRLIKFPNQVYCKIGETYSIFSDTTLQHLLSKYKSCTIRIKILDNFPTDSSAKRTRVIERMALNALSRSLFSTVRKKEFDIEDFIQFEEDIKQIIKVWIFTSNM
jgi:hypothetical protein